MRFTEFFNKNKNVVAHGASHRIAAAIPITEERDAFFNGELFKKYDNVEADGKVYRILEQCSNYYQVVDEVGNISRKFAKQLTPAAPSEVFMTEKVFHGYEVKTESAKWLLRDHLAAFQGGECDDVGLLKSLKEADNKVDDYKPKDKLTVAKIIADTVGVPHDSISDPTNLVNAAIRKAKKDPLLMKNKALLQNMLQIAREVGIKYSDNAFEVKESADLEEHIVKVGNGYELKSKKTGKNLGKSPTLAGAKKREAEVEYFKHKNESVEEISEDEAQQRVKNVMDRVPEHKRDAARKLYKDARGKGQTHAAALNTMSQVYMKEDVEQIEELSRGTLVNFSDAARKDAVKKGNEGAKAKKTEVAYSKFKKSASRLAAAAKADKKVFAKDWKAVTGQNEAVEAPSAVSYKDLKAKINNKKNNDPKSVVQKPEPATDNTLPAEHLDMATNDTTRKMIVKKLSDM